MTKSKSVFDFIVEICATEYKKMYFHNKRKQTNVTRQKTIFPITSSTKLCIKDSKNDVVLPTSEEKNKKQTYNNQEKNSEMIMTVKKRIKHEITEFMNNLYDEKVRSITKQNFYSKKQEKKLLCNMQGVNVPDYFSNLFFYKNKNETFECPYRNCYSIFPNISRVKRHFLTHTDYRPFLCSNKGCLKKFTRKDNQVNHSKNYCDFIKNRYKYY